MSDFRFDAVVSVEAPSRPFKVLHFDDTPLDVTVVMRGSERWLQRLVRAAWHMKFGRPLDRLLIDSGAEFTSCDERRDTED